MTFVFIGLLIFFGFTAFTSLRKGSYLRGALAVFAVLLFSGALLVGSAGQKSGDRQSDQAGNPWAAEQ